MKKLKKSFKILLTVSISLVCTLAIVLGCVFGLKKDDKPTNNPSEEQGYEFTTSQKALLSAINSNSSSYYSTNSKLIKEYDSSKYVDDSGNFVTLEQIKTFEDNYFVCENASGNKILYFYPETGRTKSSTLQTKLASQNISYEKATKFTILNVEGDYVCYSYNLADGPTLYIHYEVAYIANANNISVVTDYVLPLNYTGEMKYKGIYTNCSNQFYKDFYAFVFYTDDESQICIDMYTYSTTKSGTIKTEIGDIVVASDGTSDFSSNHGFYLLNNGVVQAYSMQDDVVKKYTFTENNKLNYFYNYTITQSGLFIEERVKFEGNTLINAPVNVFHDDSISSYVSCNYKFLNFKNGTLNNFVLDSGYVQAEAKEIENFDGFYIFERKSNTDRKLETNGKFVYYDENLEKIISYDGTSISDEILASKGFNFLTPKGLYSTKKDVNAEVIVDFLAKNYELATKPNRGTFAVYTKEGIVILDFDGNKVFDKTFSTITAYENGYYFATEGNRYYILNSQKLNQPQLIDGFSEELLSLISSGSGLYLTEKEVNNEKIYSFYDYTGSLIVENVRYSDFDLNYNDEFNYSNLTIKSSNGEQKNYIQQNSNLVASSYYVNDGESPSVEPFATLGGNDTLSDTLTSTYYPEIDSSTTSTTANVTLRKANGRYPASGKIKFEDTKVMIVFTQEHYVTFTATPQRVNGSELSVTVTTKNIDTPSYTGRIVIPYGFNTALAQVAFHFSGISYTYESSTIDSTGYCYADFEFYTKGSSEVYSSTTNTDDNRATFTQSTANDLTIQSLYSDANITLTSITNNVIGASITSFITKDNASVAAKSLSVTNASTTYVTEDFSSVDYVYDVYDKVTEDMDYYEYAYTGNTYKFYANYEPNTYNITYALNGGEFAEDQETLINFGSEFTVSHPTKFGYIFKGWNITGMDTNVHTIGGFEFSLIELSNITATTFKNLNATDNSTVTFDAIWAPIVYYVEHRSNYGRFDTIDSINSGTIVEFNEGSYSFAKAGSGSAYVAYGYNTTTNKTGPIVISTLATGAKYITSILGVLTTIDTHDTVVSGGVTYYFATDSGWVSGNYLDSSCSDRLKFSGSTLLSMVNSFIMVIKNSSKYGMTVAYNDVESLQLPTRTGYTIESFTFSNMSDCDHGFGYTEPTIDDDATSETTYVATVDYSVSNYIYFKNLYHTLSPTNIITVATNWNPITYTLEYNYNGGELPEGSENPTSATYDQTFSLVSPIRRGYTFIGWGAVNGLGVTIFTENSASSFINLSSTQNDHITFSALWQEISYNVQIDTNGGYMPEMFEQNAVTSAGNVLYNDGTYKYVKNGSAPAYVAGVAISSSKTGVLVIGETSNSTNISVIKVSDGSVYDSSTSVTKFTAPNGVEYYYSYLTPFVPGDVDEVANNLNGISLIVTDTNMTNNLNTIYEYYSTHLIVKFTEMFEVGSPVGSGYNFSSWTLEGLESGTETGVTDASFIGLQATQDSTVTFEAVWDSVAYTISYNYAGGALPSGLTNITSINYGQLFHINKPIKTGFNFIGWNVVGINNSPIKYGDEDDVYDMSAVQDNFDFTASNLPSSYPDPMLSEIYFGNLRNSSGTVYFTALWADIYYNIAYNLNDEGDAVHTGNTPSSANFTELFEVSMPTRAGYEFLGWTLTGLTDDCEHEYYLTAELDDPVNFSTNSGSFYDSTNVSSLRVVKAYGFRYLRTTLGTVMLTAVWKAITLNVTYHYLPLNFDALSVSASNINKLSQMTASKTVTIQYGKPFVTLIPSNSGGYGSSEAPLPNGVNLIYWAFSTTTNFATNSAIVSGSSYTAVSGTKLYPSGTEVIYDYATTDVHAYAVYDFPDITLKFYVPTATGLGNDLSKYAYVGDSADIQTSYGASVNINYSVNVDNYAFVGWMVSANHYIDGSMSKDSVSSFVYNSTTYIVDGSGAIVWGYPNTACYDVNNPVYYLYAVYTYAPNIIDDAGTPAPLLNNISRTVQEIVENNQEEMNVIQNN